MLVSIQAKVIIMRNDELNIDFANDSTNKESQAILDNEKVLCNHCKRTPSNGIGCLGMCVADNDY